MGRFIIVSSADLFFYLVLLRRTVIDSTRTPSDVSPEWRQNTFHYFKTMATNYAPYFPLG